MNRFYCKERLILPERHWRGTGSISKAWIFHWSRAGISPTQIAMDDLDVPGMNILFDLTGIDSLPDIFGFSWSCLQGIDSLDHTWQAWIHLILPDRHGFIWSYLTGMDSSDPTWQAWILVILPDRHGFTWSYLTGLDSLDPNWKTWMDSLDHTWQAWILWSSLRCMDLPDPTWLERILLIPSVWQAWILMILPDRHGFSSDERFITNALPGHHLSVYGNLGSCKK